MSESWVEDGDKGSPIKEDGGLPPDLEDNDPFSPANIGTIQFIMLARIYDLLMIDLMDRKPEVARKVSEAHHKGAILGTAPVLNGTFLESERISKQSDTAPSE